MHKKLRKAWVAGKRALALLRVRLRARFKWWRLGSRQDLDTTLAEVKHNPQVVSPREAGMMRGILKLSDLKIRDVMIARNDIASVKIDDDYTRLVAAVDEWEHSRYPVFDGQEEKVVGLLLAKDLLKHTDGSGTFDLKKHMRPAIFQPESKVLSVLLEEFLTKRIHMMIALDEFSQVAGIVTIEDVIERIVGEIFDESDDEDDRDVRTEDDDKSGEQTFHIKGGMSVGLFNEQFGAQLPTGTADNLSGWLAAALEHVPQPGEVYTGYGFVFTVSEADERRVLEVAVRPVKEEPPADED